MKKGKDFYKQNEDLHFTPEAEFAGGETSVGCSKRLEEIGKSY